MKKRPFRFLACVLACGTLAAACAPTAGAEWKTKPGFSITAELSEDQKTVTATVSSTASDPITSLQFDIVYGSDKLAAAADPRLSSPWSRMLSATSIPVPGCAKAAAATALSGISNPGGAVSSMTFRVADGAKGSAVIALENVLVCDAEGTEYSLASPSSVTVNLEDGSVVSGGTVSDGSAAAPDTGEDTADADKRLSDAIILQIGNCAALFSGKPEYIDPVSKNVSPFINSDGRTMVPLRFIAEALDAEVTWIPDGERIQTTCGGKTVIMAIGTADYSVDGSAYTMDTEPVIRSGRTFIPVRAIAEVFGMDVEWDENGRLVIIAPSSDRWNIGGSVEESAAAQAALLLSPYIAYAAGDADGNGRVSSDDAMAVLRQIVGSSTLTSAQLLAADADGNSSISANDAVRILKYLINGVPLGRR